MKIFHIATAADWADAAKAGEYRVSTLGRTLADEGFIHACYREQIPDVYREFYADVKEPLVLLHIEPARLISQVQEDRVGDKVFPHVYGPINRAAVVEVQPLDIGGRAITFSRVMLREMAWRMCAGVLFMALVAVGVVVADAIGPAWTAWIGALIGASLGVFCWRLIARRFG